MENHKNNDTFFSYFRLLQNEKNSQVIYKALITVTFILLSFEFTISSGPVYTVLDNTGGDSEVIYSLKDNGTTVATGYLCPGASYNLGINTDECTFGPPGGPTVTIINNSIRDTACVSCSLGVNCVVVTNLSNVIGEGVYSPLIQVTTWTFSK